MKNENLSKFGSRKSISDLRFISASNNIYIYFSTHTNNDAIQRTNGQKGKHPEIEEKRENKMCDVCSQSSNGFNWKGNERKKKNEKFRYMMMSVIV